MSGDKPQGLFAQAAATFAGRFAAKKEEPEMQYAPANEKKVKDLEARAPHHETAEKASQVVTTLLGVYKKRYFRKKHYRDLTLFLGFVAFYFSVLYYQRDASQAYSITSNIFSSFYPGADSFTDVQQIYDWIGGFLGTTWKDPVCGDGVCEAPFEFAYYGHFGCKADCGVFNEINRDVTPIQIDIEYNFNHPPGSIPSTTLLLQAAWNLCPQEGAGIEGPPIPHGSTCYYSEDNTFSDISNSLSLTIPDVPDGFWQVEIKNDLFNKIKGAVRNQGNITREATLRKQSIAELGSLAGWAYERTALNDLNSRLIQPYGQAAIVAAYYPPMTNDQVDATNRLIGQLAFFASTASACAGSNDGTNATAGISVSSCSCAADGTCACSGLDACRTGWVFLNDARIKAEREIRNTLGNLPNAIVQNSTNTTTLLMAQAEKLNPVESKVIQSAVGINPQDPSTASIVTLVKSALAQYSAGSKPKQVLNSYTVFTPLSTITAAVVGRLSELAANPNPTVVWSPVSFDYISPAAWGVGGQDAYLSCDLINRASQYVGTCVKIKDSPFLFKSGAVGQSGDDLIRGVVQVCNAICDCANNPEQPAVNDCTTWVPGNRPYADVGPFGAAAGSRGGKVCVCPQCANVTAPTLPSYGRRKLMEAGETVHDMEHHRDEIVVAPVEHPLVTRRRLLQSPAGAPTTAIDGMADLMMNVQGLQSQQTQLSAQVQTLQAQQSLLQSQATAFFSDKTVQNLLTRGFATIASDHQALMDKLNAILGVQNKVLAQAELAAAAAQNLQTLAESQNRALASITNLVAANLQQIDQALRNGIVNTTQSEAFIVKTMIDQQVAVKQNMLANMPCSIAPQYKSFEIQNYPNAADRSAARLRLVGLSNRVVAGLFLYTKRTVIEKCGNRFDNIESQCPSGEPSFAPFGVDPVFKLGTDIYRQDLDNLDNITRYYNCSDPALVPQPATYNESSLISNQRPFCKELFNTYNTPYGFKAKDLPGFTDGFPFFFDINLSQDVAVAWLKYLESGLYLDATKTTSLSAVLLTYNGELDHFGLARIDFIFTAGGAIEIEQSTTALRLDMYSGDYGDNLRLAGEIILAILILISVLVEAAEIREAYREKGSVLPYFHSGWVLIDLTSEALFVTTIVIWWVTILEHNRFFSPELRYPVYYNLNAAANFLRLNDGGVHMVDLAQMYEDVQKIASLYQTYIALNGVNIVFCLLRILKLMDFQPRLGVITHTMFLAYFWLFQICMVLILLNFLLAIICDAFGEVKGAASESTSVLEEVGPMMVEMWRSVADKKYISDATIFKQLKIWHGDLPNAKDVEKEEGEEKERVIRLDDDQVTREELIEIVRACVRDSIVNARAANNNGKLGGLPWLLTERTEGGAVAAAEAEKDPKAAAAAAAAKKRRGASVATEEEIIRAADMLLDQCGEDREDVETEDFSSLTHALERMLQGQQRLVDGQRLVIEGQQRVQSAEKRIEEMHHTVKELLGSQAAGTPASGGAAEGGVASFFANVANRVAGAGRQSSLTRASGGSTLEGAPAAGSEPASPQAPAEQQPQQPAAEAPAKGAE